MTFKCKDLFKRATAKAVTRMLFKNKVDHALFQILYRDRVLLSCDIRDHTFPLIFCCDRRFFCHS